MRLTVPNLLSIFRMALIPLFVLELVRGHAGWALVIMTVAGLTDALDGFVARSYHQESALGSFLDPAADKLLLTSAYVTLALPSAGSPPWIPIWISVLVVFRDVTIVVASFLIARRFAVRRFPPALISKATTTIQIVTVILVLLARLLPAVTPIAMFFCWGTAVLTFVSGLHYIVLGRRMVQGNDVGGDGP